MSSVWFIEKLINTIDDGDESDSGLDNEKKVKENVVEPPTDENLEKNSGNIPTPTQADDTEQTSKECYEISPRSRISYIQNFPIQNVPITTPT